MGGKREFSRKGGSELNKEKKTVRSFEKEESAYGSQGNLKEKKESEGFRGRSRRKGKRTLQGSSYLKDIWRVPKESPRVEESWGAKMGTPYH